MVSEEPLQISIVNAQDLEGRFDVNFHNPAAVSVLNKIRELGKKEEVYVKNLGSFGTLKKGIFSIPSSAYVDEGVSFVRVASIRNGTLDKNNMTHITDEWHNKHQNTALNPGDIAISKGGATTGKTAVIPNWAEQVNASQDIIAMKIDEKNYSGYISSFLASAAGQILMNRVKTSGRHLTIGPMRKLKILVSEKLLDKITKNSLKMINWESRFMEQFLEAMEIFQEGVKITLDEKTPLFFNIGCEKLDDRFFVDYYSPSYLKIIEDANKLFNTVRLGDHIDILNGVEVGSENYFKANSGITFIRTTDFVNFGIDRNSYWKISDEVFQKNKQDVKPEDILFTNDGRIGFSGIISGHKKCVFQSHIKRIRVKPEAPFTPQYLLIFLQSDIAKANILRSTFTQSTIPTMDDGLEKMRIPIIEEKLISKITNLVREAVKSRDLRDNMYENNVALIDKMFGL